MAAIRFMSSLLNGARHAPGYVLSKLLAASTAEAFAVPSGARYVFIQSASPTTTFVKFDGTATVPGDVTDGTAAEMVQSNGSLYYLEGVTSISVISSGTPIVTATFYN